MFQDLIKSTKSTKSDKTKSDKTDEQRVEELLNQLFSAEQSDKGAGEMDKGAGYMSEEAGEMDKGGALSWKRQLTERAKSLITPAPEPANGSEGEALKACDKDNMSKGEGEESMSEEESKGEESMSEEESTKPAEEESTKPAEGEGEMSREDMLERVSEMLEALSDEELGEFLASREVKKALAQGVFSAMSAAQLKELFTPEQANGAEAGDLEQMSEG
jgi:hypothetical protein